MIISASRRTDICAFFAQKFHQAFRLGYIEVNQVYNRKKVRRVNLKPEAVTCFVFWTRYPFPFLNVVKDLQREAVPQYFLITVNDYAGLLEPQVPPLTKVFQAVEKLSAMVEQKALFWRYDPVIISREFSESYHLKKFQLLAEKIAPYVRGVIVSFLDLYHKTELRLKKSGFFSELVFLTTREKIELLKEFRAIAAFHRLSFQTCAEEFVEFSGKCISDQVISELCANKIPYEKDPGQRRACLCQKSIDIGEYRTCGFKCLYCYAW